MGIDKTLRDPSVALILVALAMSPFTASAADLGGDAQKQLVAPAPALSGWSFRFTTYGWLPWLSGDVAVKGRTLDVSVAPNEILEHLDWSTLPSWMSYAEARYGRLSLFNDIVYSKVEWFAGFREIFLQADHQRQFGCQRRSRLRGSNR